MMKVNRFPNDLNRFFFVSRSKTFQNNFQYFIFAIIPISVFTMFLIIPNIRSFYFSFFRWGGVGEMEFIGLRNYVNLFTAERLFLTALRNTFIYMLIVMIFQTGFALIIGVMLEKNNKINSFFRTLYFLPAIFSTVAIGFIWAFIFEPTRGTLNTVLSLLHLEQFQLAWLSDPRIVMVSIAAVHIWYSLGYRIIFYITGLRGIDEQVYEAAKIEGASVLQVFFRITLPLLKPTTGLVLIWTMIGSFKAFDFVYVLTRGGAWGESEVLATLLYKEGFLYFRAGYASSIAVVLILLIVICSALIKIIFFKEEF